MTAALAAAVEAPHPRAVKPASDDTVAVDGDRQGDLVAAGVAAGGGGVPLGGRWPWPWGEVRWCSKASASMAV